jgi:hypothetical protein
MAINLSGLYNQSNSFLPGYTSDKGHIPGSNTVFDLLNPSKQRLGNSGLGLGGILGRAKSIPNIGFQNASGSGGATAAAEDDWRVRVSLAAGAGILYQDANTTGTDSALLYPLIETNGVIWPYVPQITVTHQANYSSASLTHSNYPAHFYNNSEVADIQVSGEFTVQSAADGQYLMAAVYFFRAATKMFFGQGANVGNPPPIVFLDGYGSHYFPHVPCVVTSFQHTMPAEVDYLQVPISQTTLSETPLTPGNTNFGSVQLSEEEQQFVPSLLQASKEGTRQTSAPNLQYNTITTTTRVPAVSTLAVTLKPIYSRKNLHERFDLNKFASGGLLADNDKGFGGFI